MGTTGKCPIIFTLKISAPGEGESSAVAPQKHATGFAGCSFAKPEPCACCSFSLGEKVRMRAVPEEFCLTPNCEGCISFSERCQANGLPRASNASAGRGFCRTGVIQVSYRYQSSLL